jgi:trimethylamine--corrinoid protein Co-methyltransferase
MTCARLSVLPSDRRQAIHEASLRLLNRTGVHVPLAEARTLLGDAGARVEDERVRIPERLVEQAFASLKPVTLYDRLGRAVMPLAEGRVTFGALVDTFYVLDAQSQRVRPFVLEDQAPLAHLLDGLPGIDWVQVVGQAHDVPEALQTQLALVRTVGATSKPILVYPYDRRGLLDVLDVAYLVAGGETAFRARPFVFCASVPGAPLSGTVYNLELLLTCAERGVPVVYYNCPAMGGNSPADLIGTLVLANADWLAGLVIHQLKQPGAPFCSAGFTIQLMDMRTTNWAYCAPESQMAYAAVADLAHGYGLPAFGLEANCDTPRLDAQAGVEMASNCLWGMLSGVELVHNAGMIGGGKLVAAEAFVLADEVIGYAAGAVRIPDVSADGLSQAIDLIDRVGPHGEYVSLEHTLEHFRSFWYPAVFDRSNFDARGGLSPGTLMDRLHERAQQVATQHTPEALPSELSVEIHALEAIWRRRVRDWEPAP